MSTLILLDVLETTKIGSNFVTIILTLTFNYINTA